MAASEEELKRGMEPVPFKRADKEDVIAFFAPDRWLPEVRLKMQAKLEVMVDGMQQKAGEDDELWICKSRFIGPLAGHEGVGLVRDGAVILYERVWTH